MTTITIDRPDRRNAVDGPTAPGLADAFRAFEQDGEARVAVLWGAGGTFCAGADLKALGTEAGNRLLHEGDGPMGPTRMLLPSGPTACARTPAPPRATRLSHLPNVRSGIKGFRGYVSTVRPADGRPSNEEQSKAIEVMERLEHRTPKPRSEVEGL